jgi:multidrug efflux pump subunit AcrB
MLALLITIMTFMLGLSTLMGIKRDAYPYVDFGTLNIMTRYPGASPEDVELNVTNKIEDELKGISGIENMTSVSMENVSLIFVVVDVDARDQDKIKSEIREAVGRVTDFPADVTDSPLITEQSSIHFPIIEVGVAGDLPYRQMREQARLLEKKLKSVSGVADVDRLGWRAREIRIEVSPESVQQYQIPMREIITAVQARNIRGTAGSFESYTSERDLVTLAQFRSPLQVGDVVVRSTFEGPLVRISDLAIVRDDFEEERVLSRLNGKTAISFTAYLSESADVIRTCDAIKEMVSQENENAPEGIEILYVNDTSRITGNSFSVLVSNGLIGLLLVVILLPIFLTFRTAFWVAMGIPVSLLGAIFLLPIFGIYLDTITLTGMILVIGIIVDDAIIVAENISSRRERGDVPLDAATNGIDEVFRPVLTTILTTFLVFAPMFFMPGLFGKYVAVIPLAISLALFVSLAEVTVALPAHLVPGMKKRGGKPAARKWFVPVRDSYRRLVYQFLRFRYVIVPIAIALMIGTFSYAGSRMGFILFPSDMADSFFMVVELPIGTPLQTTSDRVREVEAIVADLTEDELASFNTWIGTNVLLGAESENYAAMQVNLTPFADRDRNADEIVEELRQKTDALTGFEAIVYSIASGGPPVGKPINLRIVGSDDAMRADLADAVVALLDSIDGVKDISRDDRRGKDQVEIQVDYDGLARMGLTVADVAQNVRIAYDGQVVTSVRYGEEDVDYRVMIAENARRRLSFLTQLPIPNRQGRLIPLSQVATLTSGPGPSDYRHFDGERTVTVEADVDQDLVTPLEVTETVLARFDLDRDWPGMQLRLGGEQFETEESVASLMRTMIIAIVGVYFLLVLLFNSLTQPFLVMMAIPFGIAGAIAAFAFHGEPLSFVAILGMIGLSGVVVNDSLVLVNHVNDLKKSRRGEPLLDIVSDGTADRLRAIILTTLTTVVALLPLAYGLGGTAPFFAPMALALGWGLFFATPLTLVIIPCLYMIGQDIYRPSRGRKKEHTE